MNTFKDLTNRPKKAGCISVVALLVLVSFIIFVLVGGSPGLESIRLVGNRESNVETVIVEIEGTPQVFSAQTSDDSPVKYQPGNNSPATQRMIIHTGEITIVVADTKFASEAIQKITNDMAAGGAYIVSANEKATNYSDQPLVNMTIRIPAEAFDRVMNAIAEMGLEVPLRNETADDVTEEYVDVQARLESMEAARDRLLEIMADAETTEDLLNIEYQLVLRETEIEALKGRMQYLTQAAQLSKITISIEPESMPAPTPTSSLWQPGTTASKAWYDLKESVIGALNVFIYVVIAILPWLLIVGGIPVAIYFGVRARRNKQSADSPES